MPRSHNRRADQLRPIEIQRAYTRTAPGSVLISCGDTRVLCTATFEAGVPKWRERSGLGWVTAEYDMLPTAGGSRKQRNRNRIDGRTQEIQRLIGRSVRAVIDFAALGENTIQLDCDVIQADGGTRTASITGAYVALCDAVAFGQKQKLLAGSPITGAVAAISAGIIDGKVLLDLDYTEDVAAEVDCNVAMTDRGEFVEVQGTGESACFSRKQLDKILESAGRGIRQLIDLQAKSLKSRRPARLAVTRK